MLDVRVLVEPERSPGFTRPVARCETFEDWDNWFQQYPGGCWNLFLVDVDSCFG
jgi:hypothetical protein